MQVGRRNMSKKLVFLGCGGTIAGASADAADNVGYQAGVLPLGELLAGIKGLPAQLSGAQLVCQQVAQIDSKDIEFSLWAALTTAVSGYLEQTDVCGIVIAHGTDTLEETAFFLTRVVAPHLLRDKPVVLTCAMRPSTSANPDGPQNVLDAVAVALHPQSRGVLVSCAGLVHSGALVQKVHPYRLNPFDSRDAGPLAYIEEGCVRWVQRAPEVDAASAAFPLQRLHTPNWPRVEILLSHAGASGDNVRAICNSAAGGGNPVRGLVLAGTGNGTVHAGLEAALNEAEQDGVKVVRTTRCAYGEVVAAKTSRPEQKSFNQLPPLKARIALMLDLMQ